VAEIIERVDAYWADAFGVTPADLHEPGVRVRTHRPDRAGWQAVHALVIGDAANVFAPQALCPELATAVVGCAAQDVLDPAAWRRVLGDRVGSVLGPAVHLYLTDRSGLAEFADGRRLNPGDTGALARLRATVDAQEWEHAGFGDRAATLFGLFDGETLLAAANLTPGPGGASDVGVLTRPDVRGKGYGLRVAANAAAQAVRMCGIARYRVHASYTGSLSIAQRLGFVEYGRSTSVTLS
jgi:hypothetical protein